MPLIFLAILFAGCASSNVSSDVFSPRQREDSINWEYEKYSPSTYNSNNNILDSQDGSVQKGDRVNLVRIKY